MIEQTVQELTPIVGARPACRALGAAPATILPSAPSTCTAGAAATRDAAGGLYAEALRPPGSAYAERPAARELTPKQEGYRR